MLVASRVLGLSTVAVYSEADAGAPYLALADRAVAIGPSPASESYLNSAVLVETARLTGAQAVHPGYGFLSENSAFAADCERAGLIFVGPPSSVIETMSRKDTGAPDSRRSRAFSPPGRRRQGRRRARRLGRCPHRISRRS